MDDDAVAIGRILRSHGLHGECLTELFGESLHNVVLPWEVKLDKESGAVIESQILAFRNVAKGRVLLTIAGIETREDAKKWQGAFISVKQSELPELAKNEVREYELVGARLIDSKGNTLGTITEVFPAGQETVLGIRTESYGEVLLPFIKEFISSFKRETEHLIVKLKATVDWEKFIKQEE